MYAAEHLSLALLENLVHADWSALPDDFVRYRIEVPDDLPVQARAPEDLAPGWDAYPPPPALAEIGLAWHEAGASAVLLVPSAVVPLEHNALLDPGHPDFARLGITGPEPFPLDARFRRV